ncbi:MAG: hypothetical protein HY898_12940 [Deltaproteobacteria bacterium]|nr:hypothetical protein [Deltaproteobacteria bacterium]
MSSIFVEEMLVLFSILAVGTWAGKISVQGISLGTAGVMFVALLAGHFGMRVPKDIMDLGLILFVYAVGLQAGPRFFRTFRKQGIQFVVIGVATVTTGALASLGVARIMHLPIDLASGLYTGAMTCTPALAAAIDSLDRLEPGRGAAASVGYGIAYPYSMIGVVLLVQFLPRILRRPVNVEEAGFSKQQAADLPTLSSKQFKVTNPNCFGLSLGEIHANLMSPANFSRIRRGNEVFAAASDFVLQDGDVVVMVGPGGELDKMRLFLGEETDVQMDINPNVVHVDVDVTESTVAGKLVSELRVWEQHRVVITRLRRQGIEMTPYGRTRLEMGDSLHVVGERTAVEAFSQLADGDHHKADETNMLPFLLGLVAGIGVGMIPIRLPNGMSIKLGIAGGAFIVSLLAGHFGRVGPFRLYVPAGARNLSRELGLMLFLAGAGTTAGGRLSQVIHSYGWSLLFAGMVVTTLSVFVGLVIMVRFYRMNLLSAMGALCACMTNPPGLGAANGLTRTDAPTLAYASVYPVALIFKIILAQVLVLVGRVM